MPRTRYIGNRFLSWLTRRVAGYDASLDAQCGFTVVRRSSLMRMNLDELYDRYGFPNEMLFGARRSGLTVCSVPVRTIYGDEVSGINPFTAVPTILFLIARSFMRGRFGSEARTLIPVSDGQGSPTDR